MLSWLARLFKDAARGVPEPTRSWAYSMARGVGSVAHTVFNHVAKIWIAWFVDATVCYVYWLRFANAVINFAEHVIRAALPNIVNWTAKQIGALKLDYLKRIARTWDYVNQQVANVVKRINALRRWVEKEVFWKLLALIRINRDLIQKWAWPAFYYISHPDKLAERLFWHLWNYLERNIWLVTVRAGVLIVRLALTQALRFFQVIEGIIARII